MITAQQASDKWVQRMQAATQAITDGVNGVTQAPGAAAAARADFWLSQTQAAKAKYQQRVGAVTLQQWQTAMIQVGIPRVASGATANQQKMTDFLTKFLPYLATGVAKVKAMPKNNLTDSIARASAMIQHNAAYTG